MQRRLPAITLPYLPVNDYRWRPDYSMTALSNKHAAYPTVFIRGNTCHGWLAASPPEHLQERRATAKISRRR
jgi:hypothetical protein